MEFRILGPLDVIGPAGPATVSAPKVRALLVLLLLHRGEVVSVDRLVEDLWSGEPPRTASASLHNLVGQLRQVVGADVLARRGSGYALDVDPESVDAVRFERAVAGARAAEPAQRVASLREALALWRGPALGDVASETFAAPAARRLDALRLEAAERRIAAELELGAGAGLVAEAEALSAAHPLHEGLRESLMIALYRAGRQAEALDAYHDARRLLSERAGIDPGPRLQAAYRAILRQQVPSPAGSPVDHDQLAAIAGAIAQGRLVVVLGPSAGTENGSSMLAATLSARFGSPAEQAADLAHVSQQIALRHGLGPLYDELHRLHDRDDAAGPLEQGLAAIAARSSANETAALLFVTAAFDQALEQALEQAGVSFDVVTYLAAGSDRGRFVHRLADGTAQPITLPNVYTAIAHGQVVVLKLHGGVDRDAERAWESYAVSEDDHIDHLAYRDVASSVPVGLLARLRRSHLLFLGYPLRDWGLRVFLHRVYARDPFAYRSWAVAAEPDDGERQLWNARGVDLVVRAPETFVAELARLVERA